MPPPRCTQHLSFCLCQGRARPVCFYDRVGQDTPQRNKTGRVLPWCMRPVLGERPSLGGGGLGLLPPLANPSRGSACGRGSQLVNVSLQTTQLLVPRALSYLLDISMPFEICLHFRQSATSSCNSETCNPLTTAPPAVPPCAPRQLPRPLQQPQLKPPRYPSSSHRRGGRGGVTA
jgi:hypothetical protein